MSFVFNVGGTEISVDPFSDVELYGYRIKQGVSEPYTRVEYMGSNANFRPAGMDYNKAEFDYGDWKEAFFIKGLQSVMLKEDGTEDYLLDNDDLTKKITGEASDVANTSYAGSAMVRFPRVYIFAEEAGDYINVWISNKKLSSDFQCWAHHDELGNEIPYIYLPIYNGYMVNNKMRSLSGVSPRVSTADTTNISYCNNNNPEDFHIWSCFTFSSWMMLTHLLVLISKSTNTGLSFGMGASGIMTTGSANKRGLFWGAKATGSAVKFFGIENLYGNIWMRVIGAGSSNLVIKYKLTYGQEDGSTADGYTNEMTGYKTAPFTMPSFSASYIITFRCIDGLFLPIVGGGSASTYYCDAVWNDSSNRICYLGSSYNYPSNSGMFCSFWSASSGHSYGDCGCCVECHPHLGEESLAS